MSEPDTRIQSGSAATTGRVVANGKHLALAGVPFAVRGVTYGSFVPRLLDGELFPERWQLKTDFHEIAKAGFNVVRTYTLPPEEVLDLAGENDLRLIVGLDYRDWRYEVMSGRAAHRRVLDAGKRAVDEAMELCAGRPEVLAVSVGNEVPVDVVRLHGIRRVEKGLSELVRRVHESDPGMLVTYCNFPTTEFLQVEGQDFGSFNVFLEDPEAFRRYLLRLHNAVGSIPLVITELGLAAAVHGEEAQARLLESQLRAVVESGCAGATIFSWTDEWGVNGEPVTGWGFGLTDGERGPRKSLETASAWARSSILELRERWPRISVVVCAFNGEGLIGKTLRSLQSSHYPDLDVIVCDDGSTDGTLEIARRFPFRVLQLDRAGLSAARNAGIEAATGDIVAFIDSDAFCHPEWPYYIALSMEEDVVGTGGPNLPVPDTGLVERAVALSPGAPMEVLVADDRAEHVPGCNMAFRKQALQEIGGFNPIYTSAGDDVDVCWKLLDRGYEIGFAPAAQVHHHRRATLRGYLRQQRGYGRAEKLLWGAHRHRFNRWGQARWNGFIYGGARILPSLLRPVIYHGHAGAASYQGIVKRPSETASHLALALLPVCAAIFLSGLGLAPVAGWSLIASAAAMALMATYAGAVAFAVDPGRTESRPGAIRFLVALMHVTQPFVRLWGRLWTRAVHMPAPAPPWTGERSAWLVHLKKRLEGAGCYVRIGDHSHSWDLDASIGFLAATRITIAVTWSWTPLKRIEYRLRFFGFAAGVAALALTLAGASAGPVLLALVGVVWVAEALTLRRKLARAIVESTGEVVS